MVKGERVQSILREACLKAAEGKRLNREVRRWKKKRIKDRSLSLNLTNGNHGKNKPVSEIHNYKLFKDTIQIHSNSLGNTPRRRQKASMSLTGLFSHGALLQL